MVVVPVGTGGKIALYNGSAGTVQLVADVWGWYSSTNAVPVPVSGGGAIPSVTSIALSWTNPASEAFTAVMIRRTQGATAPASATDGVGVTDAAYPATSFNDTGLTQGLQYSYALFAHNATAAYAAAATVTATTTAAGTGAVSGLVTDASGAHDGLAGVNVQVHSPSLPLQSYATVTAADGGYTVPGLQLESDYQVCFSANFAFGGSSDATGYVDQCWQNQPTSGTPTPVAVTSVATRTGINAALAHGGAISGTVSDAGGTHLGLAHVNVQVSSPSTGTHALVSTAADGSHLVPGFPAGTAYVVCFQASGATGGSSDAAGYVDQCWNNQPAAGTATAVSVTAGHTTPGINAALAGAGAVTNVTATPDTTSVDLSWTNPTGGSLTGVVIRRAPGDIAPATATDGSPVAVPEVAKPGTTYTDTGLTSGARYSDALFAHYGASAYAAAATVSTTTLIKATMISTGSTHSCAVTTAGGIKCWGYNGAGRLSNGTFASSNIPVDVVGLGSGSGVIAVSAGGAHSCAVVRGGVIGGAVWCWGFNGSGELGNADPFLASSNVPVQVSGLGSDSGVVAVSAGDSHVCAMTSVGVVWCWGYNASGQLGDASTTDSNVPVQVSGLGSGAVAISAGSSYSCAVITGGTVKCWGDNGSGQLGNGSTGAGSSSPVDVVGLGAGASAVSAGGGHTCAVTTASGLRCWGDNGYGQLGNGSTGAGSSSPVGVTGLGAGAATAVAAGSSGHSCAVSTGGAISCWGHNANGQPGNGTLTDSWTPVDVTGLGALASAVSAGDAQSCALTAGGAVRCWGANESGQLGDGTTNQSATPVDVFGLK